MRSIITAAAGRRRTVLGGANVLYDAGSAIVAFEEAAAFDTPDFTIAANSNRMVLATSMLQDFSSTNPMPDDVRLIDGSGPVMLEARNRFITGGSTAAGRVLYHDAPASGTSRVWQEAFGGLLKGLQGTAYYNVERIGDIQTNFVYNGAASSEFVEVTVATPNVGSVVAMQCWLSGSSGTPLLITPVGDPGYTAHASDDDLGITIIKSFTRERQGATTTVRIESNGFDTVYEMYLVALVLEPTGAPWPSGSAGSLQDDFPGSSLAAQWDATPIQVGAADAAAPGGTTVVSGGALVLTPTDTADVWTGVSTEAITYNLVNSSIYCRPVITGTSGSGTGPQWTFYFTVGAGGGSAAQNATFRIEDQGTSGIHLQATYNNGGSTGTTLDITYNSTAHAYLRIRDSAGDIYWEASPSGARGSWVTLRQLSIDAGTAGTYVALSSCIVGLQIQNQGTATGAQVSVNSVNVV